jgi:uncharacterized membrane protein
MHTKLIFFDSLHQSMKGLKRGLAAFILILLFDYLWYESLLKNFYGQYMTTYKPSSKVLGVILSSLLLCSSITVQVASSSSEAIMYGALVGLVVYGCYNAVTLYRVDAWDWKVCLVDTTFGVFSTALVSYIIYIYFFG